jgi:hypothetical protein
LKQSARQIALTNLNKKGHKCRRGALEAKKGPKTVKFRLVLYDLKLRQVLQDLGKLFAHKINHHHGKPPFSSKIQNS